MKVSVSSRFLRRAKQLREPQSSMLRAALRRFGSDPQDPLLRTHKLKGELADYWAFSVDDDLRVVFRWDGKEAFLVNLGSHDTAWPADRHPGAPPAARRLESVQRVV